MTNKGRGKLLLTAIALLVALAGAAGFLLYRRWLDERVLPTRAGWQAAAPILAGDGTPGLRDGDARQARFADPFGVAVDRAGNVYLTDAGASNRIRKITPEGQVTTLAGGAEGFADGAAASASFNTPSALAADRAGNLYVADTSNNRVRKIDANGNVTTLAGGGAAGYADGPAASAQFDGPVGVAADERGNVFVADTYNDRVRQITPDGEVKTVAGGAGGPGYADGPAASALFDTPCAVAVSAEGELFVADTGNGRVRKIDRNGNVSTLPVRFAAGGQQTSGSEGFDPLAPSLDAPLGLALTHDGFLYVTESARGRVVQIAPDGAARVVAGAGGNGFADGAGQSARFNRPAGIALDRRGALYVADGANYVLRKLTPPADGANDRSDTTDGREAQSRTNPSEGGSPQTANDASAVLPRLSAEVLGVAELPWPLDPQRGRHEVVATLGEVRGSYDGESRHHLHAGVDIRGDLGATVRAIHDEKVTNPLPNWGFGGLNEGISVGLFTYVHLRVGRGADDEPLKDTPFVTLRDQTTGKASRVRVRRGTRLRVGDALGTVNRMYHVHLNFGPWGAEANPLQLPFVNFGDSVPPRVERDGIHVLDAAGKRLTEKRAGRLVVRGDVSVVVDAYDQTDGNLARRKLGLYRVGYQVLTPDGAPARGFAEPRFNLVFDRLPPERDAVKLAYADESGITVYGSAATRFLYVVTNSVRHGRVAAGLWRSSELPPGDYTLRIHGADFNGNEVTEGRDLPVTVEQN